MIRVEISPRLMPGIRIGDGWVSAEPLGCFDADGKPCWKYAIDAPGLECEGSDLRGWGDASELLRVLCSFLSAAAEAYSAGQDSENFDLFPPAVMEWSYLHADELAIASLEDDDDE